MAEEIKLNKPFYHNGKGYIATKNADDPIAPAGWAIAEEPPLKHKNGMIYYHRVNEAQPAQEDTPSGTLIDKYKEDYNDALQSIETDVKKYIRDGQDMKGLMLLSYKLKIIEDIYEFLDTFYSIIFTYQHVLRHFNSERISQLGRKLLMLSTQMKEIGLYEQEVTDAVILEKLKKIGYERKHWLLDKLLINEIEYMFDVLEILIEPEFIPLGELESDKDDEKTNRYISPKVKIAVWRRDSGKCVECGTKEKLEYDHIIPLSKGGSNTARNIQLLCEKCNRQKGAKIT